eukprot:6960265-Alexandrium_andersonii.AAC.1
MLKAWKAKVASGTTSKRKCYVVDEKVLEALPADPPDLEKWVVPRDSISLPADIYTCGVLIIDD